MYLFLEGRAYDCDCMTFSHVLLYSDCCLTASRRGTRTVHGGRRHVSRQRQMGSAQPALSSRSTHSAQAAVSARAVRHQPHPHKSHIDAVTDYAWFADHDDGRLYDCRSPCGIYRACRTPQMPHADHILQPSSYGEVVRARMSPSPELASKPKPQSSASASHLRPHGKRWPITDPTPVTGRRPLKVSKCQSVGCPFVHPGLQLNPVPSCANLWVVVE